MSAAIGASENNEATRLRIIFSEGIAIWRPFKNGIAMTITELKPKSSDSKSGNNDNLRSDDNSGSNAISFYGIEHNRDFAYMLSDRVKNHLCRGDYWLR